MNWLFRNRLLSLALLIPTLLLTNSSHSTITLPAFFSDHMVLQQQTEVAIWGWTDNRQSVQITSSWNKKNYSVMPGSNGKWMIYIATPAAGGPYQLTVSDGRPVVIHDVLIGEVWLCSGQSNMEMPMKGFRDQPILGSNENIFRSANEKIRLYTVPRSVKTTVQDSSKHSNWKIAGPETVSAFSATAYYFGRLVQERLGVPVGLVNISYGGSSAEAWMGAHALADFPELPVPTVADSSKANNRTPTTLYNGMLKPFAGYSIRGTIWYQGESNNGRPDQYEKLFPALVAHWRQEFGQGEFPFYFVQIAPYDYAQLPGAGRNEKDNSAYLRDAQRKALDRIPASGMAVLMDAGEKQNIHPANKETVGQRLAYLALAKTYNQKGFAHSSPVFDSLIIQGNIATIKFRDAPNGLTTFGKPLENFEIAGADKYFRPAKAMIVRGNVVVSSPEVAAPVAVRYAFKDFVTGELFSTEGFPVSSFRTDDW